MYHPMITFAIAQTRLDDLQRDLNHRSQRRAARASDALPSRRTASRTPRFARFATARRTRAAAV